jgi:hypothetical protein
MSECSAQEVQNVLVILQKYNLLCSDFNEKREIWYYKIDATECILRLSVPRFLANFEGIEAEIITEVYLAGSLPKNQIAKAICHRQSKKLDLTAQSSI